jgi:FkbM family methyltransferase
MKKVIKKIAKKAFPTFYQKLANNKRDKIVSQFKKDYPDTKVFYETKREIYSQDNQDYIVYNNFFKDKTDGVFCDVGGNHPLNINNTRYFEELGWSGYVFEPLPYMKSLWEIHRKAKFFPFGASDKDGEVTFSIVKDATGWEDMLSFIKETRDEDYGYETEDVTIQVKVLKDVFEQENIIHIDYMSIDVEGHELNVLKGIDFNKVRINVLTIENNNPNNPHYGDNDIRNIMFINNYILWGRISGLDDIFVHKDFIY